MPADFKLSGEDFLSLDGKVHKMDLTVLQETDPADLMSIKHLKSADRGMFSAQCDLVYKTQFTHPTTVYLLLIAFSAEQTYGHFTGTCVVDGERI